MNPQADSRVHTFSRRALLQAGWVVPAVLVLGLSTVTVAGATALPHFDGPHADIQHSDDPGHADTPGGHSDEIDQTTLEHHDSWTHVDGPDHADQPHADADHSDG